MLHSIKDGLKLFQRHSSSQIQSYTTILTQKVSVFTVNILSSLHSRGPDRDEVGPGVDQNLDQVNSLGVALLSLAALHHYFHSETKNNSLNIVLCEN